MWIRVDLRDLDFNGLVQAILEELIRAAGILLGKVTERLIRQSAVPLLAVKKKGECIGVLEALLTLAG